MANARSTKRRQELLPLLDRDHSLNGGILFGLEGYVAEVQARRTTGD